MGKFDKYGGDARLLPGKGPSSVAARTSSGVIAEAERAARNVDIAGAEARLRGPTSRIAIALDATGSMGSLLTMTKGVIAEIIRRATRESRTPIEIDVLVYRDYDAGAKVLERSGITADAQHLIAFLNRVSATGGGANDGEAIEVALQAIIAEDGFRAVLLAGDEPSNSAASLGAAGRHNDLTAHVLAKRCGDAKIPIYSFVVGNDPRTVRDFQILSSASGGATGRMDASREMIDMAVMAILATTTGTSGVRRYIDTVRLSDNSGQFAQRLLGSS